MEATPSIRDIFLYELKEIPLDQIDIGIRFRKDFDEAGLAADIDQFGLHHPILVLEKTFIEDIDSRSDLEASKAYLLLAGERRLRAVTSLNWPTIPAKITQREMSEWEMRVIELHENLQRKDLTPTEKSENVAEVHNLYVSQFGSASRGPKTVAPDGAPSQGHAIQDTADLLGISYGKVHADLEIAKMADVVPGVREAKTQSDAKKLINDFKRKLAAEELAKRFQAKATSAATQPITTPLAAGASKDRLKKRLLDRYIISDFFVGVQNIPERSVDLIELDPDWGISFKERTAAKGSLSTADYSTVEPDEYVDTLRKYLRECARVMKDNAWLLIWYSIEDWHDTTQAILEEEGFTICKMPAFWIKTTGNTATPAYRLGDTVDCFFYARKGNPRIEQMGRNNTFTFRTPRQNERTHPAEKPIELYEEILRTFSRQGNVVVVPCAGSGNALLAAENLQMNSIGFDTSARYKDNFVVKVMEQEHGRYRTYKTP